MDTEHNQLWKIEGKKDGEEHGVMKLLESGIEGFVDIKLSEPEMLTTFIDLCYEKYPADIYDLIMWDHGMEPAYGFGKDIRGGILSLADMVTALDSSSLIKDGKNFEIINFDACLMSNAEVADALGSYDLCNLSCLCAALGCVQNERAGLSAEEIAESRNRYTEVAASLMTILADDNSGDDVLHSCCVSVPSRTVSNRNIMNADGEFVSRGEELRLIPKGMSIFFPFDRPKYTADYVKAMRELTDVMPEGTGKAFIESYTETAAYYMLTAADTSADTSPSGSDNSGGSAAPSESTADTPEPAPDSSSVATDIPTESVSTPETADNTGDKSPDTGSTEVGVSAAVILSAAFLLRKRRD